MKDDQSQFSEQISTSSTHDDANHGRSRMMSTFLERAAENITLHGSVMQARERLYQRFRASSLISDRYAFYCSSGQFMFGIFILNLLLASQMHSICCGVSIFLLIIHSIRWFCLRQNSAASTDAEFQYSFRETKVKG